MGVVHWLPCSCEILLPGERDSLIQPWFDMVEQYKRLEVLDPALDLDTSTIRLARSGFTVAATVA